MSAIIEVKNVGKKYNIGERQGYIALRDVLTNIIKAPSTWFGNKIGSALGRTDPNEFWALQDLNFEVQQGEVLGSIGRNGAGKSTLLKILSQITPPTTGEIKLRGKVGSLLEVGTGFHPELTGRENIFLNGAILGMRKKEIEKKFDEIVDFSGVEKFLDTPVKRYSSGMYVRLAFAVAAHMEPEILIVDEVLAVGDAEFQKKCLGKMEDVTKNEGRTVLFVSHNLLTIQNLCERSILLDQGIIKKIGPTNEIVEAYLDSRTHGGEQKIVKVHSGAQMGDDVKFTGVKVSTIEGRVPIYSDDSLKIVLTYSSDYVDPIQDARIIIMIESQASGKTVLMLDSYIASQTLDISIKPKGVIVCETEKINLVEGKYFVHIDLVIEGKRHDYISNSTEFDVVTDIEKFNLKLHPDKSVCDRVISFNFRQEN